MAQPMTLQEFGQTIKAKHPEYADMADEDLGKRVLAKFPQYQDMVVPSVPAAPQVEMKKLGALDAGGGWSPDDLVRGAASGIKNIFAHPLQTAASMAQPFMASGITPGGMYPTTAATGRTADSAANSAVQTDAQQGQVSAAKEIAQNPAYAIGQIAGPALATAGIAKALKVGAPAIGETMQEAGGGVMNRTIGALQKDFKRGANPGRAYLDAGGAPSFSMDSLASKGQNLKGKVGKQIGSTYDAATTNGTIIPVQDVTSALRPPIQDARAVVMGPGGTGDLGPIRQFGASFRPPIQTALENGGFTPNDVFAMKKNVAQNTTWGDPTQVGMKSLRQQTTGALGNVLEDAVPDVAPLNAQYQGLSNFANRANLRAQTGSSPLTHLATKTALGAGGAMLGAAHSPLASGLAGAGAMALDSVPVKTSLAGALYYGGKGAVAVGNGIKGLYAPPIVAPRKSY